MTNIPALLTFEEAIAYTHDLLDQPPDPQALQQQITQLISSENGARGFFVTLLTGEWQLADYPDQSLILALQAVPHPTAELLIKNLVMSTAMAIAHRRSQNEIQAQGSDRVARRTQQLIQLLNSVELKAIAAQMQDSAQTDGGIFQSFLVKWGYDAEQKTAIVACLEAL